MKKIYAGPKLAAVILDSDDEIRVVTEALAFYAERSTAGYSVTAQNLHAEMTTPAPEPKDWHVARDVFVKEQGA